MGRELDLSLISEEFENFANIDNLREEFRILELETRTNLDFNVFYLKKLEEKFPVLYFFILKLSDKRDSLNSDIKKIEDEKTRLDIEKKGLSKLVDNVSEKINEYIPRQCYCGKEWFYGENLCCDNNDCF